jgi:hypothetical protein
MKIKYLYILIATATSLMILSCNNSENKKEGNLQSISQWYYSGINHQSYQCGLDSLNKYQGKSALFIKNETNDTNSFFVIGQSLISDSFKGKIIQLSAYLKLSDVNNLSGLWIRVDDDSLILASINSWENNFQAKGSKNWDKYILNVKIPDSAAVINYGLIISGAGNVWADHFEIKINNDSLINLSKLNPGNNQKAHSFEDENNSLAILKGLNPARNKEGMRTLSNADFEEK